MANQSGAFARLFSILEAAGVNTNAFFAPEAKDGGKLRVVVDNPQRAREALRAAKIGFLEEEVAVIEMYNRPGAFGRVATRLAESGIDIKHAYASTAPFAWTRVLVAVSDLPRALDLLTIDK
jgi:hypothetical protein